MKRKFVVTQITLRFHLRKKSIFSHYINCTYEANSPLKPLTVTEKYNIQTAHSVYFNILSSRNMNDLARWRNLPERQTSLLLKNICLFKM